MYVNSSISVFIFKNFFFYVGHSLTLVYPTSSFSSPINDNLSLSFSEWSCITYLLRQKKKKKALSARGSKHFYVDKFITILSYINLTCRTWSRIIIYIFRKIASLYLYNKISQSNFRRSIDFPLELVIFPSDVIGLLENCYKLTIYLIILEKGIKKIKEAFVVL